MCPVLKASNALNLPLILKVKSNSRSPGNATAASHIQTSIAAFGCDFTRSMLHPGIGTKSQSHFIGKLFPIFVFLYPWLCHWR
jgi:hypothetical protein